MVPPPQWLQFSLLTCQMVLDGGFPSARVHWRPRIEKNFHGPKGRLENSHHSHFSLLLRLLTKKIDKLAASKDFLTVDRFFEKMAKLTFAQRALERWQPKK